MNKANWILSGFALLPLTVDATDIARTAEQCAQCHGERGYSVQPDVPVIAGFSPEGFVETMDAFRNGDRVAIEYEVPGSPANMMNEIARELSDTQVEALAVYFAEIPFAARQQTADPALARRGAEVHAKNCERCHSDGGAHPEDDAAILAGQWMPYLRRQFDNIDTGKRNVPRSMLKRYQRLSADDKEALLHFYARAGKAVD
jgi:sulfide dehydrogenase cytochrome subunit